jgi:staphyloferrin B synthase
LRESVMSLELNAMNSDWPELSLAQDLLDALWLEDLFGVRRRCTVLAEEESSWLAISLGDEKTLLWQGVWKGGLLPFQLRRLPARLRNNQGDQPLGLAAAVAALQQADWWPAEPSRFNHLLNLSLAQAHFALAHETGALARLGNAGLADWEAVCSLKDRPFHPLARARDWGDAPSESKPGDRVPFHWVAVPRHRLLGTTADGQPLARELLDESGLSRLRVAAQHLQLGSSDYLWFPVHPWQWRWLNADSQRRSRPWLNECLDLGVELGEGAATASLRTLEVAGRRDLHIKFSLSVYALGALRVLPPRYLHNGALAEKLLRQLRRMDTGLQRSLWLCDEQSWWAISSGCDLIEERGELACLLRRYPMPADAEMIPMAAFTVLASDGRLPAVEYLLRDAATSEAAQALFEDITDALAALGLRCFAYGVMPELHGQNVVLVCSNGAVAGLLLRDHDTLRICPPMLESRGIALPGYRIDQSTPNTLVLTDPEKLLAYFQTLAIEVNLYAIAVAMSARFEIEEAWFWRTIRASLSEWLERAALSPTAQRLARQALLQSDRWPFKKVMAPLLTQPQLGTGMPSSFGEIANPLKEC